jgi:tripartite-type tricarboxylate transporter receptor subunit TctC
MTNGDLKRWLRPTWALAVAALVTAACSGAPAAAPTAKPAEPAKPAEAAKPAAQPTAAKPAEAAKPTEAAKPAASVDFAGKTVRIIVGYPPGGGFDSTARLLGPVLQQTIPGNPTIVIENMPGADSLIAAKTILSGPVRPDEISIVVYISTLTAKSYLAGGLDGFAVEKESAFLGKPDGSVSPLALCANSKVVKNFDEFVSLGRNLKVASTTGSSNYDVMVKWTKEAGFPIDIVAGYAGTAQMALAFNQGEVDATPSCRDIDLAQNPDWLEKDILTPLFYWAAPAEVLKKAQAEGKYPWFKSALEVKPITPDQRAVLENWNASNVGSNIYAMHKQTPEPVLETMRKALKDAVTKPEFVAEMEKRQLQVGYQSPDDIAKTVADLEKFTPGARELMKRLLAI